MQTPKRKWDTPGVALLGAGLGVLVQGSHEVLQSVLAGPPVRELLAAHLTEVSLAALASAALFAVGAVAHNILVRQHRRTALGLQVNWHPSDFVFTGAAIAIVLVTAHEAFDALSGRWEFETSALADPFSHIMWECAMAAPGGELVFRAIANIRRWNASSTYRPGVANAYEDEQASENIRTSETRKPS